MRTYQFYLGLIGFVALSVACFFLVNHLLPSNTDRKPAALPKTEYYDFSRLQGPQLETAVRKHILQQAITKVEDGNIGIQLGHFKMKGLNGASTPACEIYDSISVEFEAEGMAVGGERPRLTVTGECQATENQVTTRPLWIPIDQIQVSRPSDLELSYNGAGPMTLRIEHIGFEWPQHWVLSGIRFAAKDEKSALSIDRRQIYELSKTPLIMTWPIKR